MASPLGQAHDEVVGVGRLGGLGHILDVLFVFLTRNAVRTADFFQIPPSRVVELGAQVAF